MECYIASIENSTWRGLNAIKINFAGYNYRYPGFYYKEFIDFKEEYLKDIKEIKREIDEKGINSEVAIFNGGEPTLQKEALLKLTKYTKEIGLCNVLITNATKPYVIKKTMDNNLIDIYVVEIPAPLDERFDRVVHASTFFKNPEEIIGDVKKSIEFFRNKNKNFGIIFRTKIIPGLVYKIEELKDIGKEIIDIDASWELVKFLPEKSISKVFRGINPPSQEFIETLIKELSKFFNSIKLDWSEF